MVRTRETVGGGPSAPPGDVTRSAPNGGHGRGEARDAGAGRSSRDPLRELRVTTGVVAAATCVLVVYALLTPDGPNRPALIATLATALAIHISLLVFAGPRLARASGQGVGGLAFLVLCFMFVSTWVALDGGTASPINTTYTIPLTIAVLRVPSAARLLAVLAIASHLGASLLAHTSFTGTFDLATSMVWITQFVLTTVVTAWIATLRQAQRRKLRQLTLELEELAVRDPLTRVLNRRGFESTLAGLATEPDSGAPTALLVADLDHFKRINDAHGHAVGDQVLVAAAQAIRGAVRGGDVVARTGGEEFAIALFDAGDREAVHVADRIRAAVASCSTDPPVTASIGVALAVDLAPEPAEADAPVPSGPGPETAAPGGRTLERLHLAADRALYRAKDLGRDQVQVADPQVDDQLRPGRVGRTCPP